MPKPNDAALQKLEAIQQQLDALRTLLEGEEMDEGETEDPEGMDMEAEMADAMADRPAGKPKVRQPSSSAGY